jgi:hypothetical protein
MSINDVPGSVTFRRNWPLGLVLSLQTAILMFVFDTRSSIADLDKRAIKLEIKDEKRTEQDARFGADLAVIKANVEAIRELLREARGREARP